MTNNESNQKGPIEVFSSVVAAAIGLAAFVYISGGLVLWARLTAIHVPADQVVAILPRELLIATGLRTVVGPALILAVFALVGFGLGKLVAQTRAKRWGLVLVLVLCVVGVFFAYAITETPGTWAFGWTAGILAALVAGGLASLRPFAGTSPFVLVSFVLLAVGVISALVRVGFEVRVQTLPRTVVCTKDGGDRYLGFLIGETDSAVYVGQRDVRQRGKERVVSIPKDRVGEVWIGPTATDCTVPPPATSSPAQPSSP